MARAAAPGRSASSLWPWLGWALLILIADQFTKTLILGAYRLGDATYVTSFFNIVRAHNTGAAFSFLAQAGGWQRWLFTGFGVAAALFILWQLRAHPGQKLFAFALLEHPRRRRRQRGGPHDARLCGRLPRLPLGGVALPGLQHRRRRHHRGCGLPDRRRAAARAPGTLKTLHANSALPGALLRTVWYKLEWRRYSVRLTS